MDHPVIPPRRTSLAEQPARRRSVFREVGLAGADTEIQRVPRTKSHSRPRPPVRFNSKVEVHEAEEQEWEEDEGEEESAAPVASVSRLGLFAARLCFFTFLLAFLIPLLQSFQLIRLAKATPINEADAKLIQRQNSATNICTRWSHQSALVNGTLYIYGGRSSTEPGQTTNTWNNNFLTLDLKSNWQITSPSVTALPQPSGPPPVANGFLWSSFSQLFLYGGEYSDSPVTSPAPYVLWTYDIPSSSWSSSPSPTTSPGKNSEGGNQQVQQSAEGAGLNVQELGRGFYFGGHLDGYTTEGWSQSIARIYLRSMLEFTFPGMSNPSIQGQPTAESSGLWRNITTGGLQESAGFTERADGILVYVPGYGKEGTILGLAGGTNATFTQMNVIDVYDIETSTWYKQSTSGRTPKYRVNPCSVALSAPDGSSTNVYMFGGQNLLPYGEQTQYDDMWILSIPSFTWVEVDTSNQAVPPARAGHSCNVWNSQLVVVGGYVGQDLSCDSPGIYVFDTANLTWTNEYQALESDQKNPQNQQLSQKNDPQGLAGSFGYRVPGSIQQVIGGNAEGGATVTAPVQSPVGGPFATGSPITYSVTGSGSTTKTTSVVTTTDSSGAKVTQTSVSSASSSSDDDHGARGAKIAAIIAGVIAGLLFILACYLAWCTYMYRKHLGLYKRHVAMAQRISLGVDQHNKNLLFPTSTNERSSGDTRPRPSEEHSSGVRTIPRGKGHAYEPVPAIPPGYSSKDTSKEGESSSRKTADDTASISSTEELLNHGEPSFMGVVLNPRRTLRVIND